MWFGDNGGGLRILEAWTQKVDDTGLELQMLVCQRQIGEWKTFKVRVTQDQGIPHHIHGEETKLNLYPQQTLVFYAVTLLLRPEEGNHGIIHFDQYELDNVDKTLNRGICSFSF